MKIVILAGGKGTRLWPISRESFPKQFLKLGNEKTLLQQTIERFLSLVNPQDILLVTNQDYRFLVKSQAKAIHPLLETQVLIEPEQKNTGPAIAYAIKYLEEKKQVGDQEVILVSSSDHWVSSHEKFLKAVALAEKATSQGQIITFGARPNKPETGYGYIHIDASCNCAIYPAKAFVEKPSLEIAMKYMESGEYLWNSGIFIFSVKTFWQELRLHAEEMHQLSQGTLEEMTGNFAKMPCISIDYAVMEKAGKISVVPFDFLWSDIGSWDALFDMMDKDHNQNVTVGNVHAIDTKNSLVVGDRRLISMIGLEDMVVIETEDALFLGKKGESQRVKELVAELKKTGKKETQDHLTTHRPWGYYKILESGPRYKVKRILVDPLQVLSLQMHYHRSEHWVVVQGTAKVTIGESIQFLHENQSTYVPKGTLHRLENPGKIALEIIEVQVGEYLGEDDIVRLEDLYGRQ